jgi:hypothetical protein
MADPLVIVVTRQEVESLDITGLEYAAISPCVASDVKNHFGKIDLAFHGYDDDSRELFENPDVRNSVFKLDDAFPYWFYFLSKNDRGLQGLILCFMPPYLTEAAKQQIFPERL